VQADLRVRITEQVRERLRRDRDAGLPDELQRRRANGRIGIREGRQEHGRDARTKCGIERAMLLFRQRAKRRPSREWVSGVRGLLRELRHARS
jgi:hypothetical protein